MIGQPDLQTMTLAQLERWLRQRWESEPVAKSRVGTDSLAPGAVTYSTLASDLQSLLLIPRTAAVWHMYTEATAGRGYAAGVGAWAGGVGSWTMWHGEDIAGYTREYRARAQYYYSPSGGTTSANISWRTSAATSATWLSDPGAPYGVAADESYVSAWAASAALDAIADGTATYFESLGQWASAIGNFYTRYFEIQYRYVKS